MKTYYDRYKHFRIDGKLKLMPPIRIKYYNTDLTVIYNKNKMRLDNLSYKYYGDPNFGWLLMMANPEYGSLEFNIPDGVVFRIPYPLESAIERYETQVKKYVFD